MKDFVMFIARAMAEHPDDVVVTEVTGRQTTILELRCHPKDVGRLIGRSGKTISALRTLVSSYASQKGCRTVLELAE